MKMSDQMVRLLSTGSLAKISLDYFHKDMAEGGLKPIELQFWDTVTEELIRRGVL